MKDIKNINLVNRILVSISYKKILIESKLFAIALDTSKKEHNYFIELYEQIFDETYEEKYMNIDKIINAVSDHYSVYHDLKLKDGVEANPTEGNYIMLLKDISAFIKLYEKPLRTIGDGTIIETLLKEQTNLTNKVNSFKKEEIKDETGNGLSELRKAEESLTKTASKLTKKEADIEKKKETIRRWINIENLNNGGLYSI